MSPSFRADVIALVVNGFCSRPPHSVALVVGLNLPLTSRGQQRVHTVIFSRVLFRNEGTKGHQREASMSREMFNSQPMGTVCVVPVVHLRGEGVPIFRADEIQPMGQRKSVGRWMGAKSLP